MRFCQLLLTFGPKNQLSSATFYMPVQSQNNKRGLSCLSALLLLTDFVCLYNYEFGLSLCKIVRSSVILLLPLLTVFYWIFELFRQFVMFYFSVYCVTQG